MSWCDPNALRIRHPDSYGATFNHVLTRTATGSPNVVNTYDPSGRLKTRNAGLGVTA